MDGRTACYVAIIRTSFTYLFFKSELYVCVYPRSGVGEVTRIRASVAAKYPNRCFHRSVGPVMQLCSPHKMYARWTLFSVLDDLRMCTLLAKSRCAPLYSNRSSVPCEPVVHWRWHAESGGPALARVGAGNGHAGSGVRGPIALYAGVYIIRILFHRAFCRRVYHKNIVPPHIASHLIAHLPQRVTKDSRASAPRPPIPLPPCYSLTPPYYY